ncbi:ATP-dependent DNA helicase DinG [Variovorax guangxiensis]|uniref:ATP-dependent DNA helicase DinG n=1 Tax=Variovorax guangxiensis TaxID=1775474 RepID=A0A502DW76_9BURK|nr:ATP-dependent DNA helicase DinG [Variovorax guangxiensis]TPG25083.1 ATP-dependent DNA helicase DinG [Variovorax ginsengisoli]TPG29334.1 ATP-dependent DNA helicase DinG [Variovorax guangxiensis]
MSSLEWAASALQAFDGVVQASAGFRSRDGQRRMAERVADTLAAATLGKAKSDEGDDDGPADPPVRAIAVIQAGTGVGKSLAYCAPAIALALARNTRVVISTATVALQEQLVNKDLPALAKLLPQPFRFALAKGRGRYVCQLKLERLTGMVAELGDDDPADDGEDDLFADDDHGAAARPTRPAHEVEARLQFYTHIAQTLATGAWDGDRDTLDTPPASEAWLPMAADAASCTGKHCPSFNQCVYYERRKLLVGAQVIVVNHDLLLASLGNRQLPELDNCLLILDEAHHLPATALAQFGCRMDLGRHGWVERLAQRAVRVGVRFEVTEVADVPMHAAQMRQALQETERLVMDLYGDGLKADLAGPAGLPGRGPARARLPRGELPEVLQGPLGRVAHHASGFLEALRVIASALRVEMREQPAMARKLSTLYAQLGALAPRLEQTLDTAQLLLREAAPDAVPAAKWFTLEVDGDQAMLQAHASPLLPGATLRHQLWSKVRGAVLTSATLTSCGHFDFFLRESGLHGDAAATTLEVPSPFDYAAQGRLIAVETHADPRDAVGYVAEMVQSLVRDLADVRHGALVLFTSRDQLRQAVEALPATLKPRVLLQTAMPRQQLLDTHRHRVAEGLPSIIFGMQSFGEGLDLPGKLCESVFIAKLPFAPPDDPVGEARAEWLRTVGRDPFTELVVPATAIRLAQWVGRAIRSEEDRASVYCYDRRLVRTSYGQRLLKGLPPFAFSTVRVGDLLPV